VEVDLAHDRFTVTTAGDRPTEAEMIAAVEGVGFGASVVAAGSAESGVTGPDVADSGEKGSEEEGSATLESMPTEVREALQRAAEEGKWVLVDFYADWCGPCKRMLRETYPAPSVVEELSRYVFLKVNTDEHPSIARRFGVTAIPDARILAPDGTEVARISGFHPAEEVAETLRKARGGSKGGD